MKKLNSVKIVEDFWAVVWRRHNLDAIDRFVVDDCVITTGGGSPVASRWRITGKNNGVLGMPADQRPIDFTGTAVWAVREDGKLLHNWVERSSWELFQRLNAK